MSIHTRAFYELKSHCMVVKCPKPREGQEDTLWLPDHKRTDLKG
jgi:hypothetical protein